MKKILVLIIFSFVLIFSFSIYSGAAAVNGAENLFPVEIFLQSPFNRYGIDYINNEDGSFTLNGTTTQSLVLSFIPYANSFDVEAGIYILGGAVPDVQVVLEIVGGSSKASSFGCVNKPIVVELTEDVKIRGYVLIQSGITLDNVTIYPYLTRYEVVPYGTEYLFSQSEMDVSYNNGCSNGYAEGYSVGSSEGFGYGFNDGRAEGYELGSLNGEKVGYIDGYKSGYTNYKLSTEYKSALENKYSSGFKEGVASVEQEESDMTLAILIPSIVIECILGIFLTVFLSRKKQRRKNK